MTDEELFAGLTRLGLLGMRELKPSSVLFGSSNGTPCCEFYVRRPYVTTTAQVAVLTKLKHEDRRFQIVIFATIVYIPIVHIRSRLIYYTYLALYWAPTRKQGKNIYLNSQMPRHLISDAGGGGTVPPAPLPPRYWFRRYSWLIIVPCFGSSTYKEERKLRKLSVLNFKPLYFQIYNHGQKL